MAEGAGRTSLGWARTQGPDIDGSGRRRGSRIVAEVGAHVEEPRCRGRGGSGGGGCPRCPWPPSRTPGVLEVRGVERPPEPFPDDLDILVDGDAKRPAEPVVKPPLAWVVWEASTVEQQCSLDQ